MKKPKPWWEYPHPSELTHDFSSSWAEVGMANKALAEGRKLTEYHRNGGLKPEALFEVMIAELRVVMPDLRYVSHHIPTTRNGEDVWTLVDQNTMLYITYTKATSDLAVNFYSVHPTAFVEARPIIDAYVVWKQTQGRIFVVAQSEDGPELMELPDVKESFEPGNYAPHVVEHYRHIVADLNRPDPCGRVAILDGPPGTGKTHMVRAILNEVKRGIFILVPSNMVSTLGSPQFVMVLLRQRQPGTPIVLIIEDGDECLSSRKADNVSEVSALLNFGDGIIGSSLDLRLVTTTNVELEDIDPAVFRARRLCRRVEIGPLSTTQARTVYNRLTPKAGDAEAKFPDGHTFTLAEIYQAAFGGGDGYTPPKQKRRAGFNT